MSLDVLAQVASETLQSEPKRSAKKVLFSSNIKIKLLQKSDSALNKGGTISNLLLLQYSP